MRHKALKNTFAIMFAAFLSLSASDAIAHERLVTGTQIKLGEGGIWSWAKTDHGRVTSLGVTFTENALKGLPAEPPKGELGFEYVLDLPAGVSGIPFRSIVIDWNPKGHIPDKIYDVGHFDFHFYLIPEAERVKITAIGDDLKTAYLSLPEDLMPEGYILAPESAVPRMGAHLADPNSHEFHGQQFTKTFLYGAYAGKLIFLEPMITRAYLETKPNVTETIKLPTRFEVPGYYPTSYSVRYDAENHLHTVALEGMVFRPATAKDAAAK